MKKFTLNKAERLTSKRIFGDLIASGQSMVVFPFRIYWKRQQPVGESPVRIGFSVPKKKFKKATLRNLIRRRMREAYRKNKYILYDTIQSRNHQLSVLFIYVADEAIDNPLIEEKIIVTLEKLSSAYEESL